MKQNEIKPCLACGKGVMHTGSPAFFRVNIQHMLINIEAVRRQAGLEQVLGGHALLAFHMGPQENIASVVSNATGLVCQNCALDKSLFEIAQIEFERQTQDNAQNT